MSEGDLVRCRFWEKLKEAQMITSVEEVEALNRLAAKLAAINSSSAALRDNDWQKVSNSAHTFCRVDKSKSCLTNYFYLSFCFEHFPNYYSFL